MSCWRPNKALTTVCVLEEDVKRLWAYRHAGYAKRLWGVWYRWTADSGIAPLLQFAGRLCPYLGAILAHCRYPLHTTVLEGINNKVKVVERMAYSCREEEYFFLKIRGAFPGDAR